MEYLIETFGLEHVYGGTVQALSNVSFKVPVDTKIFGVLGPNGAGKTTLMNILTTSIKPTKGEAKICGYNILKQPDKVRPLVSYVTQEIEVDALLSVYDNLYIYGRLRGLKKREAEKRAEELIEKLGLVGLENRLVLTLSGGQMRRVQLARCLVVRPKILFVDEPTLGLDPVGKKIIWNMLRGLSEEGTLIILSSNDMAEVEKLCEDTIFINHGKIICQGSPDELKEKFSMEIVIKAKLRNNRNDQNGILEIKVNNKNECTKVLSRILPKTEWITIREPTLEEIFAEIVRGG